jgi:hypothetical protein
LLLSATEGKPNITTSLTLGLLKSSKFTDGIVKPKIGKYDGVLILYADKLTIIKSPGSKVFAIDAVGI